LYLTHANIRTLYGRTNRNPMSRFISEIPEHLIDGIEQAHATMFGPFEQPLERIQPTKRRQAQRIKQTTGAEDEVWKLGDKASHKKWGTGTVVNVKNEGEATELDVAFPAPTGIKRLLAKFAPITKL